VYADDQPLAATVGMFAEAKLAAEKHIATMPPSVVFKIQTASSAVGRGGGFPTKEQTWLYDREIRGWVEQIK
jgi:hypothetical protein